MKHWDLSIINGVLIMKNGDRMEKLNDIPDLCWLILLNYR